MADDWGSPDPTPDNGILGTSDFVRWAQEDGGYTGKAKLESKWLGEASQDASHDGGEEEASLDASPNEADPGIVFAEKQLPAKIGEVRLFGFTEGSTHRLDPDDESATIWEVRQYADLDNGPGWRFMDCRSTDRLRAKRVADELREKEQQQHTRSDAPDPEIISGERQLPPSTPMVTDIRGVPDDITVVNPDPIIHIEKQLPPPNPRVTDIRGVPEVEVSSEAAPPKPTITVFTYYGTSTQIPWFRVGRGDPDEVGYDPNLWSVWVNTDHDQYWASLKDFNNQDEAEAEAERQREKHRPKTVFVSAFWMDEDDGERVYASLKDAEEDQIRHEGKIVAPIHEEPAENFDLTGCDPRGPEYLGDGDALPERIRGAGPRVRATVDKLAVEQATGKASEKKLSKTNNENPAKPDPKSKKPRLVAGKPPEKAKEIYETFVDYDVVDELQIVNNWLRGKKPADENEEDYFNLLDDFGPAHVAQMENILACYDGDMLHDLMVLLLDDNTQPLLDIADAVSCFSVGVPIDALYAENTVLKKRVAELEAEPAGTTAIPAVRPVEIPTVPPSEALTPRRKEAILFTLDMACHPETPTAEVLAALDGYRKLTRGVLPTAIWGERKPPRNTEGDIEETPDEEVARHAREADDLAARVEETVTANWRAWNELRADYDAAEKECGELKAKCAALEAQNNALKAQLKQPVPKIGDRRVVGGYKDREDWSYRPYEEAKQVRFGKPDRWFVQRFESNGPLPDGVWRNDPEDGFSVAGEAFLAAGLPDDDLASAQERA